MMQRVPTRPRLSLRAASGLIVVAAVLIWGATTTYRLHHLAAYYRGQVAKHDANFKLSRAKRTAYEAEAQRILKDVDRVEINHIIVPVSEVKYLLRNTQRQAGFEARLAEYHLQLKRKYEDAASHPWIEVVPDPHSFPEPKPEREHE